MDGDEFTLGDDPLEHHAQLRELREVRVRPGLQARRAVGDRRFTEEVGVNPGRRLIQQKVGRARHLLETTDLPVDETTDLPVDEIAGQVSFAAHTSLRQHLHAAIGVSPSAYRRTFRGHVSESGYSPGVRATAAKRSA